MHAGEHEGSAQRKPQGPAPWGRDVGCFHVRGRCVFFLNGMLLFFDGMLYA